MLGRYLCKSSAQLEYRFKTHEDSSPEESSCFKTQGDAAKFFNGTAQHPVFDYKGNFTDETEVKEFYALVEPTEKAFSKLREVCEQIPSGQLMEYVGTVATVRDIVAMHDYFEEEGSDINFWGFS